MTVCPFSASPYTGAGTRCLLEMHMQGFVNTLEWVAIEPTTRKMRPVEPTLELREVAFNAANRSGRWEYRLLLGISVLYGPKRDLTNTTKTIL